MPKREPYFQPWESDVQGVLAHLEQAFGQLRTGRASPSLVEDIPVEAYGARTPLKQIASISISDPRSLLVQAWDPTVVKDIEKALTVSGRALSCSVERNGIRVHLTALTEESRRELSKVVKQKLEESRSLLRKIRDTVKESILSDEREKKFGEDERYRLQKHLDEWTSETQTLLDQMAENKEKEIMTI